MKIKHLTIFLGMLSIGLDVSLHAQTVLSGNHVVEGNLGVGDSTTKGNLTITGTTGSSALPSLSITGDGGTVFKGTFGTGQFPMGLVDPENGYAVFSPFFLWYSSKAALVLAGPYDYIDPSSIGEESVKFPNSYATGSGSVAMAAGIAYGEASFAIGGAVASGDYSIAMSQGWANGEQSIAMSGNANGYSSTAISGGLAQGVYSVAIGFAYAQAAYSVVLGRNNVGEGDPDNWVSTDPLFVVGNGADADHPNNAFTIYKSGDIKISKRQGDILMGEFGD